MLRRFTLFLSLLLISIYIGNGKLIKLFNYIIQLVLLNTINQEQINTCSKLQISLDNYVRPFRNKVSISVLNDNGDSIVNINSRKQMIPASNQKILSSAFALEKLGPDYTLNTSIKKLNNGNFILQGNGDPDLTIDQLDLLIKKLEKYNTYNKKFILYLVDEPKINWWPSSWTNQDKKEEYGSPITMNSLSSNSSTQSLRNPISYFKNIVIYLLNRNSFDESIELKLVSKLDDDISEVSTLMTIKSAPVYVLLSLVNSESHNFTSEVLFRQAQKNSNNKLPFVEYNNWLDSLNIETQNFVFADASGLSRENRVTAYGLTQFLRRMSLHRYSDFYFSSYSILGLRGTISEIIVPNLLKGNIIAKSGTLNNVKSLSGLITNKNQYFSIIFNGIDNSIDYIVDILYIISLNNKCD